MTTTNGRANRGPRLLAALATLALAALALSPAAVADSGSPSPSASGGKVTFTVGLTQDVDSLNPFAGYVVEAYEVWGLMYDSLTGYSLDDFSPVPGFAESWTRSDDGLVWTYKLRSGAKWSDGLPVTAKDAAYTFNRVINGEQEQVNYGNYVANMSKAEAVDDTTLRITLKETSPIMERLAVPILPEHIWKQIDEAKVRTFANDPGGTPPPVGSGPFVLTERKTGQFLRLKANKEYWAGAPKVDEIVFRIFQNEDAMVQALRKGEIDIVNGLGPKTFDSLKGQQGITPLDAVYSGFDELAFNYGAALVDGTPIGDGHPALKDKRVRHAIEHAIDRQVLLDKVIGGSGSTGTTVIPPIYAKLHLQPAEVRGFDPAKANQLLDEAGYKRGADGVRTMPDGTKPLNLRLFGRAESQTSQQSVAFIKSWLQAIGIATTVKIVEENKLTEIVGEGEFDLFEWGWVVEPDPDFQLSTFTCGQRSTKDGGTISAGLSDSFYCSKEFDALYAQQRTEIDPVKRAEIVQQAQQLLYDDAPYVVTVYYNEKQAYRSDRWQGITQQPPGEGVAIFQYGTYTYRNVAPIGAAGTSTSSSNTALIVGGALAALVLVGGVAFFVIRGRRSAGDDDRE